MSAYASVQQLKSPQRLMNASEKLKFQAHLCQRHSSFVMECAWYYMCFFSNFRPFIFVSLCFVDVWRKRKKPSLNSQVKWLSDSTYKKSGLKRLTQSFTLFACFCSQKKIWENRLKFGSCNRFTFEFCIIKVISLMWLVHLFEQLKFLLN